MCLVTAIGAFYQIENYRGRHAWQEYHESARARGLKMDLQDFLPPPVPAEDNFAATPSIAAIDSNLDDPPQGFALPAEVYKLITSAKGRPIDLPRVQEAFLKAGLLKESTSDPAADILRAVAPFDTRISEMRLAAKRPKSQFPPGDLEHWIRISPTLGLTQLIDLRVQALLAIGKPEQAMEEWLIPIRLCQALKTEPMIITGMVRIALFDYIISEAENGAAAHIWTESELAEIEHELGPIDLVKEYPHFIGSERAWLTHYYEVLRTKPDPEYVDWRPIVWKLQPQGWIDQNLLRANLRTDAALSLIESGASAEAVDAALKERFYRKRWWGWHPYWVLVEHSFIAIVPIDQGARGTQCRIPLCRIACALERFRIENGAYPDRLAQLVPGQLPQIPDDPIDHGQFRFEKSAGGGVLVSAVGPDGQIRKDWRRSELIWRAQPLPGAAGK